MPSTVGKGVWYVVMYRDHENGREHVMWHSPFDTQAEASAMASTLCNALPEHDFTAVLAADAARIEAEGVFNL